MKKLLRFILSLMLCCTTFHPIYATSTIPCSEISGSNEDAQNYRTYAKPVKSYLEKIDSGWMRFIVDKGVEGYMVDTFNEQFEVTSRKIIETQLPIFGGFYTSNDHYYIVSGQSNMTEDDTLEVIRVSQYDKEWNHMQDAVISGINTTVPFDAGSCRMSDDGTYLIIHTSHEMYQDSDGVNHQANLTLQIKMENMALTDQRYSVSNATRGYVSHSFNQFVTIDGNQLITLDHGDAHPRAISLFQHHSDISDGTFTLRSNEVIQRVDLLEISGEFGNNTTNASVGGLVQSQTHYLVVGNSAIQDEQFASYQTRNIFVSAIKKDDLTLQTMQKTTYEEGTATTSTPMIVKMNDTCFVVLYEVDQQLTYFLIDSSGHTISDFISIEGSLSDCQPQVNNDTIVWYSYDQDETIFYQLKPQTKEFHQTKVHTGHQYEIQSEIENGYALGTCLKCNEDTMIQCITNQSLYWNETGEGYYSSSYKRYLQKGNRVYYLNKLTLGSGQEANISDDVVVSLSNPDVLIHEGDGESGFFKAINIGSCEVTFTSKYNPTCQKVYTFIVEPSQEDMPTPIQNAKIEEINYKTLKLSWDESENTTAYEIYRKESDGDLKRIATINELTYQVNVKTGVVYTYQIVPIRKINGITIKGTISDFLSKATSLKGKVQLSLNQISEAKIQLSWNLIDGATRYVIYRKAGNNAYQKVLTLGAKVNTYTSGILKPQTYKYKLKPARYDSKDRIYGSVSNEVSATTSLKKPKLTSTKENDIVTLTWDKVDSASYYQIYRKKSTKGTYKKIKTVSKLKYSDTLTTSITYYKVKAYCEVDGQKVYSPLSNEVTIKR